jgi:hypothetical protein
MRGGLQRSEGGGSFQAVDLLNGKLLCGCDDIHACVVSYNGDLSILIAISNYFNACHYYSRPYSYVNFIVL